LIIGVYTPIRCSSNRSCTSSLRIIQSPEKQVASPRSTDLGGERELVHDLLFHALLLLGMLWLYVILRWVWRQRHDATSHATTRATRCSHANQPFPGFIHKPSCATCEDGAQEQAKAPPAAPRPMVTIRGCPRRVDTQHHCCRSPHCAYYGWVGFGNVRANGHPNGGRWRQLQCVACRTYFLETHGTPLHGTRVAPELVV
jgi:hypothetical protein